MILKEQVVENYAQVKAQLAAIKTQQHVDLLAVSKQQPVEAILALLEVGHSHFGENKVQEAQEKWPALRKDFPQLELHLIGHLQSNKAEQAVALFDVIETVDRVGLVDKLAAAEQKLGLTREYFLQVNIGEEEQKSGVSLAQLPELLEYASKKLRVTGLMCIPPVEVDPSPYFALMAKLQQRYALPHLSMGMSADHQQAVVFGSTQIRVGTRIFGARA